ncbi:Uncharacterised protein [Neisseria animalis]|nr:Uncharacterised protein [Neisseria animalis]
MVIGLGGRLKSFIMPIQATYLYNNPVAVADNTIRDNENKARE